MNARKTGVSYPGYVVYNIYDLVNYVHVSNSQQGPLNVPCRRAVTNDLITLAGRKRGLVIVIVGLGIKKGLTGRANKTKERLI